MMCPIFSSSVCLFNMNPANVCLFTVNNNKLTVNNKDTRTTPLASF